MTDAKEKALSEALAGIIDTLAGMEKTQRAMAKMLQNIQGHQNALRAGLQCVIADTSHKTNLKALMTARANAEDRAMSQGQTFLPIDSRLVVEQEVQAAFDQTFSGLMSLL